MNKFSNQKMEDIDSTTSVTEPHIDAVTSQATSQSCSFCGQALTVQHIVNYLDQKMVETCRCGSCGISYKDSTYSLH